MRKISYAGITVFWLVTMAILLSRHYGIKNIELPSLAGIIPKELYEEQWMGVYYKGEKIGYSNRKMDKWNGGYRISELLKMNLIVMGTSKEIETMTDAYLDSNFVLQSFNLSLSSDANMNIKGIVSGKNLSVSIETLGTKSEQTITLKDKPSLNLSMIPEILREGMKPNKKFTMMMIDPATLSQEDITIEVMGKEQIMSTGKKQDAFKLKGSFKGIEFFEWITEKGEVLREESPLGFTLIKENKEDAMQIGRPSLDLIAQTAVPFNMKLSPDISYLKVKLSGINFKRLDLDGGRQKLKGDVLEIKKEALNYQPSAFSSKSQTEYLKDTMFIQSKNLQIISLSKEIIKDEKDIIGKAKLIHKWVYKNIKKVPAITIPMATEILKTKRGDCNEHTTLYTALARAADIPTRIALGLVYKDGFFYYHAWPEIFIGDWIAIDPTLGQFPAGAAHIRLITGDIDRQIQMLNIIGKIKIEGLEYR